MHNFIVVLIGLSFGAFAWLLGMFSDWLLGEKHRLHK